MSDVQKIIHDEIVKCSTYGVATISTRDVWRVSRSRCIAWSRLTERTVPAASISTCTIPDKRKWTLSIKTESFDLTFGSIHYAGTRLTIPIDDDEYMVYRVEIANHRRGSSSLVTFHLDRDDSRPEHKTVGQSASAYLSVDEAKQIMQALQQAIKEADDE